MTDVTTKQNYGTRDSALRSVLRVAVRRRVPVILALVLVPLVSVALSLSRTDQFTATASLLFRDPQLDQALFGSTFLAGSRDPDREAATNVRLVSLKAVSRLASKKLNGEVSADLLQREVKVTADGRSDLATVAVTDPSPIRAARIANAFATQYIDFRRKADRAKIEDASRLIQRELSQLTAAQRAAPQGQTLRRRSDEVRILASLQTGNAELVQAADVPEARSSPNPLRAGILGVFLGVLLAAITVAVVERLDRRLRDEREVEELFGRPRIGSVPMTKRTGGFESSEAFRILRFNLRYFGGTDSLKIIVVTSGAPGEGKSTTALGVALSAAEGGARVLLVEADLRRPSLRATHLVDAEVVSSGDGLSQILSGQAGADRAPSVVDVAVSESSVARLYVVFAGPTPPNPGQLLDSPEMIAFLESARQAYDLVVVDTPPLLSVADAIPIVKDADGVIVVARLNVSRRDAMSALRGQLEAIDAAVLGVVLNGEKPKGGYSYQYGYGVKAEQSA